MNTSRMSRDSGSPTTVEPMQQPVHAPPAGDADQGVVLEAREITKRFGEREALKGVWLQASRGELVAIIGPNGAGKTTLLSILAGIQRADSGSVSRPPGEIGWVPQQAAVYNKLTVAENLRLFARLEKRPDVDAAVEGMLAQTGLEERRDDPVAQLSGGNRQRVNIAIGLLASPDVLLLDEPSAALDPRQRERLWEFIGGLAAAGRTVIYSTHNVQEAERYAAQVVVLADGERLFAGSPRELEGIVGATDLDFEAAFVAFLRQHGH
jgi:ABC-2 type transport system ATP-binding protein